MFILRRRQIDFTVSGLPVIIFAFLLLLLVRSVGLAFLFIGAGEGCGGFGSEAGLEFG